MKSLIENLPIKFWTEDGIPYAETRSRMGERSDEECAIGAAFIVTICPEIHQHLPNIFLMAMKLRNTVKLLNKFEPIYRESVEQGAPGITPKELERIMECHALFIESIIRVVNKEAPPCKG